MKKMLLFSAERRRMSLDEFFSSFLFEKHFYTKTLSHIHAIFIC